MRGVRCGRHRSGGASQESARAAWGRRASGSERAKGRVKGLLTAKGWGAGDSGRNVFLLCSKGAKRGGGRGGGGSGRGRAFTDPGEEGEGEGGSGKTAGGFRDGVGGYPPIHSTTLGAVCVGRGGWRKRGGLGFGKREAKFFKGAS